MLGYLVWNKAQCKGLDDEPNLGHVVFQTTDITQKDKDAGFESQSVDKVFVEGDELELSAIRFCAHMLIKLFRKREEGFDGGFDKRQCSNEYLSERLRECVDKGDPIDVANFAMFIHQRGETINMIGREPAGYLHTKVNVFVPVEAWNSMLPETRSQYKPVFW